VAGLDGQDGAGGRQVRLGHDVGGGAQVGGNTDTLEDRGRGQEAVDVRVAKVVCALGNGCGTGSYGKTRC
jgi:hypothetical protein